LPPEDESPLAIATPLPPRDAPVSPIVSTKRTNPGLGFTAISTAPATSFEQDAGDADEASPARHEAWVPLGERVTVRDLDLRPLDQDGGGTPAPRSVPQAPPS